MKGRVIAAENGQTLIMVALALVVLIGFLALAVDVGHTYAERRKMQNAADAGALAGAWELCFGTGDPLVTAEYYAEDLNGAQDAVASYSPNAWTVDVVASETADMFFAQVIGIPTMDVAAEAAAACGEAKGACGLWPVGFPEDQWQKLYADGNGCGTPFYVWAGEIDKKDPDCTIYDCDVPDESGYQDGIEDIVPMEGRAWLDFGDEDLDLPYGDGTGKCPNPGCSAAELKDCITDGYGGMITLPSCIAGDSGVKAGIKASVDSRKVDVVGVPLYDEANCDVPGGSCPGESFRVVDFGCITVLGWSYQTEFLVLPRLDGDEPPWEGKFFIKAAVSCDDCVTSCGGTGGGPPPPEGIGAVSLIK